MISFFLCILLAAGVFAAAPLTAYAEGEEVNPVLLTGKCGVDENSDVEYYCFTDGSMAIFGTGAIRNYSLNGTISTAPWYSYDYNTISTTLFVTKIAVEYGVTSIGDYCFYIDDSYNYRMIVQLNNIDIANTVTSIGKYAFYNQKIQQIVIPPSVTHIGANAFRKCTLNAENGITYYGDPAHLTWDSEGDVDAEFPNGMKVHILDTYSDRVDEFNSHFAYKHITFVADASNPYASEGEALDRNIAVYYGSVNSNVFGGAAPFIIVGRFDGKKKSVTYGSSGFASCVQDGSSYYILTNNTTGALNLATCNSLTGKVTGYAKTPRNDLELKITHSYIGTNTVKMIYTLKNTGSSPLSGLKLGGTGDIKIGADDKAAIEPLMQDVGGSSTQVGFYMKSGKNYDKDSSDNYATLGFIGKNVSNDSEGSYPDATFFYGEVDANKNNSAAGSKALVLMPERIFSKNTASGHESQETGEFDNNKDSGMSFYWNNITLQPNEQKQYAVLFSVYGASDSTSAGSMITDLNEDLFYNVTWKDYDGSVLVTQVVKKGDTPAYPGANPTRPRDSENNGYTFSGWTPTLTENIGGTNYVTEYTAEYTSTHYQLFRGHSLTLRGDIGVNFFVDVTPEQVREGVKIRFNWYDQQSEYTLHESDFVTERGLYRARCNVSAAEMTDVIRATAYFNGTEYTREHDEYSVRQYASEIINPTVQEILDYRTAHPGQYANLLDLVKKMLDYGAKAQIVFNHNASADKLANKGVDYTMTDVGASEINAAISAANDGAEMSNMNADTGTFGLKYYATSVVFLSKTSLRHYYTVTDRTLYNDAKGGASFEVYENKPPYVYFEMQDISASKLDTLQQFTIGEHTYLYSVLDFARSLLDDGRSDAQQALGKATYWYNQAANVYFGN